MAIRIFHTAAAAGRWLNGLALGVALAGAGAAIWSAQTLYEAQRQNQVDLAVRSAQSAARETATLIGEMRRNVELFALERSYLFEALQRNPSDDQAQRALEVALQRAFPDQQTHTLVNPNGQLVIDDMGEHIGDLCLRDIAAFNRNHTPNVVIHPGPDVFHFDLMVPWYTPAGMGTFFVSFRPDRLAQLLAEAELPQHRLMLVNSRLPSLIEVTAQGARDVLQGEHMLSAAQVQAIQAMGAAAPVPGTLWTAVSLPNPSVWAALERERMLRVASAVALVLAVVSAAWWVAHTAWQRQTRQAAEQRLTAAVFNSAQEGIAITDLAGRYIAVNRAFLANTEFGETEVLGQTPQLLNAGRHQAEFYQGMWRALRETGQWQGEIWNRRKHGDVHLEWLSISSVLSPDGQPEHYVAVYTDISRMRHATSELERLAHHDALTGLPNRLLLLSRIEHALERAQRNDSPLAVLYLDLDGFKAINDSLGHPAGDRVLQQVADRLTSHLRSADTVARLGGDEFVVLLEDLAVTAGETQNHALAVARELADWLAQPMTVPPDTEVRVGASIGISHYPIHGTDAATLLAHADEAMYLAKQGKTGIAVAALPVNV